jgi:hypothetical protein
MDKSEGRRGISGLLRAGGRATRFFTFTAILLAAAAELVSAIPYMVKKGRTPPVNFSRQSRSE